MTLELQILDWIQNLRSPFLDKIVPIVTNIGSLGICWIVLTVVLLVIPKTRRLGIAAALALILESLVCNLVLKPLVARTRPCDINTAVQLLIARPTDYSFPSGHTAAGAAVGAALFFMKDNRIWIPTAVLALAIAFTRLYLYVHFPTDVLGGAAIGVIGGYAGAMIVKQIEKRKALRK